jgi:hypothetical protein
MEIIDWIVLCTILVNTMAGISVWKKSTKGLTFIIIYFVLQSILEIWSDVLLLHKTNNQFLYHFFIPVLFLILSYVFYLNIKNMRTGKWLLGLSIAMMLICWCFSFTIQSIKDINSYAHLATRLVLCSWVVLYFRQLLYIDDYEPLIPNYMFWVSVSVLIHVANYCFYGVVNVMLKFDGELASEWYSKALIIDLIFYCTLALPFYQILYSNNKYFNAK